jgi:hypothetical protein
LRFKKEKNTQGRAPPMIPESVSVGEVWALALKQPTSPATYTNRLGLKKDPE